MMKKMDNTITVVLNFFFFALHIHMWTPTQPNRNACLNSKRFLWFNIFGWLTFMQKICMKIFSKFEVIKVCKIKMETVIINHHHLSIPLTSSNICIHRFYMHVFVGHILRTELSFKDGELVRIFICCANKYFCWRWKILFSVQHM